MILIRKANKKDVPEIKDLIAKSFEAAFDVNDIKYDVSQATRLAEDLIKHHLLLVLVEQELKKIVGGIGGQLLLLPMSVETKAFQEIFFYVLPTFRGYSHRLLHELEEACKYQEIEIIIMAHLSDKDHEKMDRFYFTKGYKLLEKHYYRRI
jgi:GNAT superfamily N-acetyltransferase